MTEGDMAQANKLRFSCEYADNELGVIYYNYRYLNPHDGRWINRDPVEEKDGWNLYSFVKNATTLHSDSLGLESMIKRFISETEKIKNEIVGNIEKHLNDTIEWTTCTYEDSRKQGNNIVTSSFKAGATGMSNFIGVVDIVEAIEGSQVEFVNFSPVTIPMDDGERMIHGGLGALSVALTVVSLGCGGASSTSGNALKNTAKVKLQHITTKKLGN